MTAESSSPEETAKDGGPAIIIRLNPAFGGGRVMIYRLDSRGSETEIGRFLSEKASVDGPPDVSPTIRNEIEAGNKGFIVDLEYAPWLDSTGLGYLVRLETTIRRAGGFSVFTNISERLMELLKLMKLDTVFRFAETVEAARDYLDRETSNR